MIESTERVEQFKAEIADMRLRDPSTGRDAQLLRVGVVGMVAGLVITIAAYFGSHGSTGAAQQDYIVVALIGVALSVVGAALFLRYSVAQFLRFWLARLIYEQQAQTDRIVGTAAAKADGVGAASN
jgi:hypothetical protein